jgi:hypothetical protein
MNAPLARTAIAVSRLPPEQNRIGAGCHAMLIRSSATSGVVFLPALTRRRAGDIHARMTLDLGRDIEIMPEADAVDRP